MSMLILIIPIPIHQQDCSVMRYMSGTIEGDADKLAGLIGELLELIKAEKAAG